VESARLASHRSPLTSAHGDHLCSPRHLLLPIPNSLRRRHYVLCFLAHQGTGPWPLPSALLASPPLVFLFGSTIPWCYSFSCCPSSRREPRASGAARSLLPRSRRPPPPLPPRRRRNPQDRPLRLCWAFPRAPGLQVSLGWGSWRLATSLISSSRAPRRSVPSLAQAAATSSTATTPSSLVISW